MSNTIFPVLPGLSWTVGKTPNWSTRIQRAVSGKSLRAARYANPIWHFSLTYEVLRADTARQELQQLMSFFNERQGAFDSFLYQDPYDKSVTAYPFGTGNGTTRTFQFTRQLYNWIEPVAAIESSPLIYDNGSLVSSGAYTVNQNSGTITFGTPPVNGHLLTWTGNFYFRCCFVKDALEFDNFMKDLWTLKKCELESVR